MEDSSRKRHSNDEYLTAVHICEPAATAEIAERVGVARQSADYRLRQLEDEEKVQSKKAGSSLVWMSLVECEICGERVPRADIRMIVLGGVMESVGLHEEAPISDTSVHELCSDCADEWEEWLHSDGPTSYSAFVENAEH